MANDKERIVILRAENARLREELEEATQYNDLFHKCMRRALLLWQEKHPDSKLWLDAAKNFCWVYDENERLRNALRDILCITRENYHTGCMCFSCTAYEIAHKALEAKCSP